MINTKIDYNENNIDSMGSYNVNNNSFYENLKSKFSSLKGIWNCNPPLNSNSLFTTGILSKAPQSNAVRITLLNQSNSMKYISISAYNWTEGFGEYLSCNKIYLSPYSGRVIDILLQASSYDDSFNFELYEIRISPYTNKVKVNIFEINTNDTTENG